MTAETKEDLKLNIQQLRQTIMEMGDEMVLMQDYLEECNLLDEYYAWKGTIHHA